MRILKTLKSTVWNASWRVGHKGHVHCACTVLLVTSFFVGRRCHQPTQPTPAKVISSSYLNLVGLENADRVIRIFPCSDCCLCFATFR